MQTCALGIPEQIDALRGAIARIEQLRARCKQLEADGADPAEIEYARALWRAHEREFGTTQWQTVKRVIEWQTVKAVIEHAPARAIAPTPPAPPPPPPPPFPPPDPNPRKKTILILPPPPEVRRARYLAANGKK